MENKEVITITLNIYKNNVFCYFFKIAGATRLKKRTAPHVRISYLIIL